MKKMTYEQKRASAVAYFWNHVVQGVNQDMCWSWTGRTMGSGYAHTRWPNRNSGINAARASWMIEHGCDIGDIPMDPTCPKHAMSVLHSCPTKVCCNPRHLRLGTNRENIDDKRKAGTSKKGRARPRLADDVVRKFIVEYVTTDKSQYQLTRELGLPNKCAYYIVNGHTHRKVMPEVSRPIQKIRRVA